MPRWPKESQDQRNQKERQLRYILKDRAMKRFRKRLIKRDPAYLTMNEIINFLNLRSGSTLREEIKNRGLGINEWSYVTKIGLEDSNGQWMGSWIAKLQPMKSKKWWKKIIFTMRPEYSEQNRLIK